MTTIFPAATRIGRVSFIGGGFMGEGIVQGLLARGVAVPADICVCEVLEHRRALLQQRHGVQVSADIAEVAHGADVIVLAMKPQDFPAAAATLAEALAPEQLIVSIMAGVTLRTIREGCRTERVVRAMPNTPGAIGQGFTVWTGTPMLTTNDRARAVALLEAIGRVAFLADEKYLDMATAVSGSGPGFVLLLIEAMIDAAVLIGFGRDLATEMVLQTFAGSAAWAQASGQHPAQLRNAVTSPGGTTAAGLLALEKAGVRAALSEAVVAALERSRALGG